VDKDISKQLLDIQNSLEDIRKDTHRLLDEQKIRKEANWPKFMVTLGLTFVAVGIGLILSGVSEQITGGRPALTIGVLLLCVGVLCFAYYSRRAKP